MSTRAVYIFKDKNVEVAVYKHWDGCPEGAKTFIARSLDLAWPLPRFEADEFAAAFVAVNKIRTGDIRLLPGLWECFPWDIEYVYQVQLVGKTLKVNGWSVSYNDDAPLRTMRWSKTAIKGWTVKPLAKEPLTK